MSLKIDPDEYYPASQVLKNGFFPWILSDTTFRLWIPSDQGKKLLKPVTRIAGRRTLRYVKGSNLIELHKISEDGKLTITFNGKTLQNPS